MKSSDQIKEIRSRLNLSQSELAEKLGVSFATVNRWEKGHCEPSHSLSRLQVWITWPYCSHQPGPM